MSIVCDECEEYVHNKEDFKFLIRLVEVGHNYDPSMSLCYTCFDNKFSVKRYARLCAKENQHLHNKPTKGFCCLCDEKINKVKDKCFAIRCFDHKVSLEVLYCNKCYQEDVGIE